MKKNANLISNYTVRLDTLARIVIACLISFSPRAFAITRTWNGGVSGYWNDGNNWSPNGIPQNGDDLIFNNSPGSNMTNNIAGLSVRELSFTHSGALWGQGLTVTVVINATSPDNGPLALNFSILTLSGNVTISSDNTQRGLTLNCEVNLNGHDLSIGSGNAGDVTFQNRIYGAGNLSFSSGANYLQNLGADTNSFTGSVTVTGGTLNIGGSANPAISGDLYIGFGASVVSLQDFETGPNATVEIYSGGSFLLDGHTTSIGNLVMSNFVGDAAACVVDSGTGGLLGVNGLITSYNESQNVFPTVKGQMSLNIFNPIATFGFFDSDIGLDVQGVLSGNGFSKAGNAVMNLDGTNSYSAGVEVDQGTLAVWSSGAFPSGSGVLLYGSGRLELEASIANVTLDLQGTDTVFPYFSYGSVIDSFFGGIWGGPLVLHTNLLLFGGPITFSGVISGPGNFDFHGSQATIGGTASNTFSGSVLANGTLLLFDKQSPSARAFNGPLIVGGSSDGGLDTSPVEVRWMTNYQNPGAALTLYSNAFVNLSNWHEDFGTTTFYGGTVDSGPSGQVAFYQPVTVYPNDGATAMINGNLGLPDGANRIFNIVGGNGGCDLQINALIFGTLTPPTAYFVKQGAGTMCLMRDNTYDAIMFQQGGILDVFTSGGLGSPAGTILSSGATVRFNGTGSNSEGFEIAGSGVGGTHGALEFAPGANWTLNGNILLDADTTIQVNASPFAQDINGLVYDLYPQTPHASLTKAGSGSLVFGGTSPNTYSGITTVAEGGLSLAKPDGVNAIPGELFVGLADGSTTATCTSFNNYQVFNNLTVYPGGTLDLNGHQENTDFLSLYGNGAVTTGAGYLSLKTGGDIIVHPSSNSTASISGIISLDPGNHHFNIISSNDVGLLVTATISQFSGAASIEKTGPGVLKLNADNTFGDNVYVSDGTLIASSAGALGSQNIYVLNNASLYLYGGYTFNLATLVLNSSNSFALRSAGGSNAWTGAIGLYQPTTVYVDGGAYLQVLNSISGSGGLTKTGPGRLQFWGFVPNVYVGGTTIAAGILEAGRVNQVSIPGDVVLGSDADLVIAANLVIDREQQFSTGANVTAHKSGFLILNPNPSLGVPTPVVGTLSGGGGVLLGPINGSLTVSNSSFCTFPGVISGSGKFIKDGPAKMQLTANNTYIGNTVVNGGVLQVDGSQIQSAVQVNAGKLQGTGTVGPIAMNASSAVVEPGNSPGILNCGNFDPGVAHSGYLNFELNGLTPGTGYDQLYVLGTVNLTGITLAGSLGFNSAQSNSFTIIQNDGTDPIAGTFVGLPQNATVTIGWQQFQISYTGGDGNDVVLTQISSNAIPACDPAPSGLVAWWPGDGNANDIIGGNNGTLQNGTAFVPGVVGQAFSFDGVDDQVVIPGFCNLVPTNEITVEFWQKVGSVRNQFNFCPATPNGNNIFDVSGPWGDGVFYWEFGNANTHAGQLAYTPTNTIIGAWQHFACVASQSGNYMKIYRNGVLEAQKPVMTPFVKTNEDFVLGGDAIHPYHGQLDEVSIYNRELSSAEILAIYNAGLVGKCLNAVYITSINRTGNTVDLTWLSQPGVTYRVQSNAALNSANWIDASGDITAASTSTSISLSDAASQKYYRVAIQR